MVCMSTRLFCNGAIVPEEAFEHVNKAAKLPIGRLYVLSWRRLWITYSEDWIIYRDIETGIKKCIYMGKKGPIVRYVLLEMHKIHEYFSNCNGGHHKDVEAV